MDVSRRDLLKGGAIFGAGIAATAAVGLYGCAEEAKQASNDGANASVIPAAWDYEADIVVLGCGYAGIGAAVAGNDAGNSVLIVECMDEEGKGGASGSNGGLVNSPTAERLKFNTYGKWSDERCEEFAERAAAARDWMANYYEKLEEREFGGAPAKFAPGMGVEAYWPIVEETLALPNVSIEYNLRGRKLVSNPDTGEVLGLVAERDGQEVFVKASKGVVLATGGYEANPELVEAFHFPAFTYASAAGPARVGDGLLMAGALGARVGNLSQDVEWTPYALKVASKDAGGGVSLAAMGVGGAIYVNAAGKRFDNESRNLTHNKSTLPFLDFHGEPGNPDHTRGYVNLPLWAVWDAEMVASTPIAEQRPRTYVNTHGFSWSQDNLANVEKGYLIEADAIEELASKMQSTNMWGDPVSVDATVLAATIDEYNGFVAAGEDKDFGRDPKQMKQLATGPFYAAELIPQILYTINGLVISEKSEVLDWNNEPIKRLYAAGDVCQGVLYSPITITGCCAQGQIASEQITALDAWDA